MSDTITNIPLEQLRESPFNPRRTFNEAGLDELAADIRDVGVQQPLLVRPTWSNTLRVGIEPPDGHEIVFGHRRFRAAQRAGLGSVPCMVRQMTDAEARRAQVSENLQREDIHPIEEAEGFQALMNDPDEPISADGLAEKLGKSRSYVYGRLKLLQACKEVRDACLAGTIGSEVALLIARLRTDKLQAKALGYIKGKYLSLEDGGAKSFRQIRDLLAEQFTLEIKKAMFDPEDDTLVFDVGACSACPKRAGNAPEYVDLVEERKTPWGNTHMGDPDVCTDPDCFESKKKAHLKRKASELEAKGKTVIDGTKARAAIDAQGNVKGAYVALKDVRDVLKKAAKDAKPATVTIQDPRTGKTVEAVKREDLKAAGLVKESAAKPKSSNGHSTRDYAQERLVEREAAAQAAEACNKRLMLAVRQALAGAPLGLEELRMVTQSAVDNVYGSDDEPILEELCGMPLRDLDKRITDMDAGALTQLLVDCALVRDVTQSMYGTLEPPEQLLKATARLGINAKAVLAGEQWTASTPSPAARAPKKAAAKAGGPVKYQDPATGQTWSGRGLQPMWLKAALAGGKALSDFAVSPKKAKPAAAAGPVAGDEDEVKDDGGFAAERDPRVPDMFEEAA